MERGVHRIKILLTLWAVLLFFMVPSATMITTASMSNDASRHQLDSSNTGYNNDNVFHVVIADIDTGINPYHRAFRRPAMAQHPSAYIEGFPKNTPSLNLTFGRDYESDVRKDSAIWKEVKDRTLYWIPRTNILAISFGKFTKEGPYILDQQGHGTGTASVIAQENPDAFILMVQTSNENLTEALSWAVNQSWMDIISSQFFDKRSVTGSPSAWEDYPEIAKKGVENGKIIINSAGNRKTPPWYSNVAGPPWIINVGGGRELLSWD